MIGCWLRHVCQLLVGLLLLPFHYCGPVSTPEIYRINDKVNVTGNQDVHLRSLNVYANANQYNAMDNRPNNQQNLIKDDDNQKGIFKLPQMEHNFAPITPTNIQHNQHTHHTQHNPSLMPAIQIQRLATHATPMLMQYLPQNLYQNGVQYLHLLPARPVIIPINSYMTPDQTQPLLNTNSTPTISLANNRHNYLNAQASTIFNTIPLNNHHKLYQTNTLVHPNNLIRSHGQSFIAIPGPATASSAISIPLHVNLPPQANYAGQQAIFPSNYLPYNLNYRTNRDTKDNYQQQQQQQQLATFALNLNEYLPGPITLTHLNINPNKTKNRF